MPAVPDRRRGISPTQGKWSGNVSLCWRLVSLNNQKVLCRRFLLPAMHHWGISGGLLGWAGLAFLGCKQGVDRTVF